MNDGPIQSAPSEAHMSRSEVRIAPAGVHNFSAMNDGRPYLLPNHRPAIANNAEYGPLTTSEHLYPETLDCDQGWLDCDQGSCSVDPFNSPPRHIGNCDDHPVGRATPTRATPASRAGTSFFVISPSMSDALSLDVCTDLGPDISSIPSALDLSQALYSESQSDQDEACTMVSAELKEFGGKNPFYATAARVCRGFDMSQFRGAKVL
eukprot:gnl/MRDRNA2_/MRDRNA2_73445_c0_seq1.p1 gnl/MRDRNA2_/MRDRNA2_73445_c0~~gnl/MRDRNA2_/MRDRNA2_73445_c0_seq1.p1  ORF type:complete len:220 (-),score=28.26 gnl/MRDRNA2_/MRDRNA2_73445_c0_seq1:17-637(-)